MTVTEKIQKASNYMRNRLEPFGLELAFADIGRALGKPVWVVTIAQGNRIETLQAKIEGDFFSPRNLSDVVSRILRHRGL